MVTQDLSNSVRSGELHVLMHCIGDHLVGVNGGSTQDDVVRRWGNNNYEKHSILSLFNPSPRTGGDEDPTEGMSTGGDEDPTKG